MISMFRTACGSKQFYRAEGNNKVTVLEVPGSIHTFNDIDEAIQSYKWNDQDVLLTTFPKTGTHFMLEITSMLLNGSTSYTEYAVGEQSVDIVPCTKIEVKSPRVLHTHYRLDCMPEEFHGKKTVLVLRNPKDTYVSSYHYHYSTYQDFVRLGIFMKDNIPVDMENWTFSEYLRMALTDKDASYGTYFDYLDVMWNLRTQPNVHVIFFEDMKRNPVNEITKLNKFLGVNRSPELIAEIADKTTFSKLKEGKAGVLEKFIPRLIKAEFLEQQVPQDTAPFDVFRKGDIGDWKNHFTVADNEAFDKMLEEWQKGRNIPFIYE